mmetsp:Transcript_1736/g.4901  ORF Transcript_1736/g.4901 Transcript_1736/m.4901 type:complete len:268 (+) Transcript_1736:255-1058(+)
MVQERGGGQDDGVPFQDVRDGHRGQAWPQRLAGPRYVRLQAPMLRRVAELHGDALELAGGARVGGVPKRRGHQRHQGLPWLRRVGRQGSIRVRAQLQVDRRQPRVDPRAARPQDARAAPQCAHVGWRATSDVARCSRPRRARAQLPRPQRRWRHRVPADGGASQGARLPPGRRQTLLCGATDAAVRRHCELVVGARDPARHAPRAAAQEARPLFAADLVDRQGCLQGHQGCQPRRVHRPLRRASDTGRRHLLADGGEPQGDGRRQGW